jgi:hypothetical protein
MSNQLNIFNEADKNRFKAFREDFYKGVKERAIKRREEFLNDKEGDISILLINHKK